MLQVCECILYKVYGLPAKSRVSGINNEICNLPLWSTCCTTINWPVLRTELFGNVLFTSLPCTIYHPCIVPVPIYFFRSLYQKHSALINLVKGSYRNFNQIFTFSSFTGTGTINQHWRQLRPPHLLADRRQPYAALQARIQPGHRSKHGEFEVCLPWSKSN